MDERERWEVAALRERLAVETDRLAALLSETSKQEVLRSQLAKEASASSEVVERCCRFGKGESDDAAAARLEQVFRTAESRDEIVVLEAQARSIASHRDSLLLSHLAMQHEHEQVISERREARLRAHHEVDTLRNNLAQLKAAIQEQQDTESLRAHRFEERLAALGLSLSAPRPLTSSSWIDAPPRATDGGARKAVAESVMAQRLEQGRAQLRALDEECRHAQQEMALLESQASVRVHAVLSQEWEHQRATQMAVIEGLRAAVAEGAERVHRLRRERDDVDGELCVERELLESKLESAGVSQSNGLHPHANNTWKARYIHQYDALRDRLKEVRAKTKALQQRRTINRAKVSTVLPQRVAATGGALASLRRDHQQQVSQLTETLAQLNSNSVVLQHQLTAASRERERLIAAEVQLTTDMDVIKRDMNRIAALAATIERCTADAFR